MKSPIGAEFAFSQLATNWQQEFCCQFSGTQVRFSPSWYSPSAAVGHWQQVGNRVFVASPNSF
jgi:hypothetical protein